MENSNATPISGLQFFNATGVRQPKSVNESVIVAESTRASFKLMPAINARLGIQDGDYVTMQMTKDENGVVTGVYIGKGKNATYERNEDGSIKVDDRNRKVVVDGMEGFGALASELTAGSNVLKISVASAWDALGDTEVKKHYILEDEVVSGVNLPIGNGEYLTTDLFKLKFLKDEDKVVRNTKAKDDAPASTEQASTENAVSDLAQNTVSETPATEQPFENGEF